VYNANTDDFDSVAAASQLPGRVLHCQLDNNQGKNLVPVPNSNENWFIQATQGGVDQVVFYCTAGAIRSPNLALWYMQQNIPAGQSVCLLSGGYGKWSGQQGAGKFTPTYPVKQVAG
jgi:hypothetical protein